MKAAAMKKSGRPGGDHAAEKMPGKRGSIRIIGGQWKRRRIRCAEVAGLRPSPDAVRETLFNWLPHALHEKTCLDLFAGSGAFGFEAASRGAPRVVMVESHPKAVAALRANRENLPESDAVEIFAGTVNRFMQRHDGGFDLIFMDPPFADEVIQTTCETLQSCRLLNPHALVYIESKRADCPLPIPSGWHIIRASRRGVVQSTLIET